MKRFLILILILFMFSCIKHEDYCTLTLKTTEGGYVVGDGEFEKDGDITIEAIAIEGYKFACWNDYDTCQKRTIKLICDTALIAYFAPEGALTGIFSIDNNRKVFFSKGNLQYNAAQNVWRFADQQCEIVGLGNTRIAEYYNGWIDLFGWGTSGYDNTINDPLNIHFQPWASSFDHIEGQENYYGYGPSNERISEIKYYYYDWGLNNPISNGGNKKGMWRAMTWNEWEYLIMSHRIVYSLETDIEGIYLLPDNYTQLPFSIKDNWVRNEKQRHIMEKIGALFLPAAGYRIGKEVYGVKEQGVYCSSVRGGGPLVFQFFSKYPIYSQSVIHDAGETYVGRSVRLVYDIE